jgi:hypothetical protein
VDLNFNPTNQYDFAPSTLLKKEWSILVAFTIIIKSLLNSGIKKPLLLICTHELSETLILM